jgi:ABC-type glycerol-3-phosphate transport system permease component
LAAGHQNKPPAEGGRECAQHQLHKISAATLMTVAPLLIAFRLFQRQFVQSFMRAETC